MMSCYLNFAFNFNMRRYTKETTTISEVTKTVTKGGKTTTSTSITKSVKSVTGTETTVTTQKTVPIEGILDDMFFRGFFYGEAEIQQAADVGLPASADVSASVAISFSAMNPPMDFQLDEMAIEAEFNMEVEKIIKIQGACKFTYPLRTPIPVTAWVDFDLNIPGIDFPRLEANITIYPADVPAAVKKGRALTASLRTVDPFGFTYAGIDVEVSTMVSELTLLDNGRVEAGGSLRRSTPPTDRRWISSSSSARVYEHSGKSCSDRFECSFAMNDPPARGASRRSPPWPSATAAATAAASTLTLTWSSSPGSGWTAVKSSTWTPSFRRRPRWTLRTSSSVSTSAAERPRHASRRGFTSWARSGS